MYSGSLVRQEDEALLAKEQQEKDKEAADQRRLDREAAQKELQDEKELLDKEKRQAEEELKALEEKLKAEQLDDLDTPHTLPVGCEANRAIVSALAAQETANDLSSTQTQPM